MGITNALDVHSMHAEGKGGVAGGGLQIWPRTGKNHAHAHSVANQSNCTSYRKKFCNTMTAWASQPHAMKIDGAWLELKGTRSFEVTIRDQEC